MTSSSACWCYYTHARAYWKLSLKFRLPSTKMHLKRRAAGFVSLVSNAAFNTPNFGVKAYRVTGFPRKRKTFGEKLSWLVMFAMQVLGLCLRELWGEFASCCARVVWRLCWIGGTLWLEVVGLTTKVCEKVLQANFHFTSLPHTAQMNFFWKQILHTWNMLSKMSIVPFNIWCSSTNRANIFLVELARLNLQFALIRSHLGGLWVV